MFVACRCCMVWWENVRRYVFRFNENRKKNRNEMSREQIALLRTCWDRASRHAIAIENSSQLILCLHDKLREIELRPRGPSSLRTANDDNKRKMAFWAASSEHDSERPNDFAKTHIEFWMCKLSRHDNLAPSRRTYLNWFTYLRNWCLWLTNNANVRARRRTTQNR